MENHEEGTLTSCPTTFGNKGIFVISAPGLDPFPVLCDARTAGVGYAVIASRSNADLSFFRSWEEYKRGFGDISGDFFLGLDKLHAITKSQTHELYIHLEDFEGTTRFARYDEFYIESEQESYKLSKLGNFSGDAGDSLDYHRNQTFSTYDRGYKGCAIARLGAWWYNDCTDSNLFGMYFKAHTTDLANGMVWYGWRGPRYSYKTMKMLVRPKCACSRSSEL
ncbi:uncharacterized protein Dwil_GK15365 [Drosophila willistoni]|uniref:Fibrinogen C-terminal domain-containing protein n=1 Tax=Drosophila willistoni TaxID=7260 RepID=B4MUR7_DROWI|nr:ficolin-2 [Drosophila willistoni]EDW76262.2 uncharacterized protein Dwil_GK15365 [Drosophila willistoni]